MKIKWIGPQRHIPDLGKTVEPGDELELPKGVNLGGEGTLWETVATTKKAKAKEDDS